MQAVDGQQTHTQCNTARFGPTRPVPYHQFPFSDSLQYMTEQSPIM